MSTNTITITRARRVGLAAVALAAAVAADAATPVTVAALSAVPAQAFFEFEMMSEAAISPDGDAVAVLVRGKSGRRHLAVIDTADLSKISVPISYDDADIENAGWVDDKRIVFSVWDEQASAFNERGAPLRAVDRDGGNLRDLLTGWHEWAPNLANGRVRGLGPEYRLIRTTTDGSGDIVIAHWVLGRDSSFLYAADSTPLRLDTRTGTIRPVLAGDKPAGVTRWEVDGNGHAVAATADIDDKESILLPQPGGTWKAVSSFARYGVDNEAFSLVAASADGSVYATRAALGGGKALFRLDLATGRPEPEPLVSVRGFDVDAHLIENARDHKLIGVRYQSDAEGTAWFDPGMKTIQAKVDTLLPGMINRIDPARCGCAARALVTSFSDRQPPLYFLFDRASSTLIPLGASRPAIDRRQMADTDFVRIKTRDGRDMPAYVTKPHGKGPWPTVVLLHGGPWLRGWHWEWDGESQFLASRGYLVVKPEFRGSRGYGDDWEVAGFRQWGLAMQDDIADATRWAAEQGMEDPSRVCIAGASYGGYATLMGLVRYPDLYKCGVAWSAVTDINLMYDISWSDMSDNWKAYGMPKMVGDQVKDAAQLQATSPLQQAARITRPLLLAHGGVDPRVPIDHASKLKRALESAHAPLTWIEYPDEAHGWYKPETRISFYEAMEKFLGQNIGSASK